MTHIVLSSRSSTREPQASPPPSTSKFGSKKSKHHAVTRTKATGLATIFLFTFCRKIIVLPGGQKSGRTFFFFAPPSSYPVSNNRRAFFEQTQRPSMTLNLTFCIANVTSEIPGHLQVGHAKREGPMPSSKTTQILIAFLSKTLFDTDL